VWANRSTVIDLCCGLRQFQEGKPRISRMARIRKQIFLALKSMSIGAASVAGGCLPIRDLRAIRGSSLLK